jgi:hypothetical protein
VHPKPSQRKRSQEPEPNPRQLRLGLDIGERVDPAAADALWQIVLGGIEADTGGGPSAEGAGTRQAGRHPGDAEGIAEAGHDDLA